MNIISKIAIATVTIASTALILLSVNGDEMKTSKVVTAANNLGEEPKSESISSKTAPKISAPKQTSPKSNTQKVATTKTPVPGAKPKTVTPAAKATVAKATTAPARKVADLTPSQTDKVLVLLNQGTTEELASIKGVAGTRAASIVSARPFKTLGDLILVPGVGDVTVDRIIEYGIKLVQSSTKSAKS